MNVAIFASAYYPHIGGVEETVRQLVREYRRRGIDAIVLTNRWPRSLPFVETYEGTTIHRLAMRTPEGSLKAKVNYRLTHQGIYREMLSILEKHRVELLHVQCVSSSAHYALIAKKAMGLPLVVTTQGERTMDATGLFQRSKFMNGVLRDCLREADAITACSRNTLNDMEAYWGKAFGSRASVVYNGIDPADFNGVAAHAEAGEGPYILGIGRLVRQKGFDVLLRAFARANPSGWRLLIAGEGPERESLERLISELGLGDRAKLLGPADRPTATSLFLGCSLFVLPSRMEPLGIVNLEAMAAGKAVVASRVGGVPEIVAEGETGLLVPAEDPEALAAAIAKLAGDTSFRERLGAAGQRAVARFSWPVIAAQYERIYAGVSATEPALATA